MRGMLFSQMQPPPELETEFHDWYDTEHIPVRLALPGFESAVRYEIVAGHPRYLAVYHISDMNVIQSKAYRQLKDRPSERARRMLGSVEGFTRYVCDLISDIGETADATGTPGLLFVVAFEVPVGAITEFDSWYEEEHVGMLLEADDWLRVRRYRVRQGFDGPPISHFAVHDIRNEKALEDPARARAGSSPRRARLAAEPWFGRSLRWLYRPIFTGAAGTRR